MEKQELNNYEAFLKDIVGNDNIGIEPDPEIRNRLINHMNLQNRNSEIQKNSILGMILSFFTLQHLGFKTALISVAIIFSFFFGNFINNKNNNKNSNSPFYVADSFNIQSYDSSMMITDSSKIWKN